MYNTEEERSEISWKRHSDRFALRKARSPERLLDQTLFFLHCGPPVMNAAARQIVEILHCSNRILEGRKALIVDDDMRNIFALTTVLDDQGMVIVSADNGREAIRRVKSDPAIDIVLMDIMMPEMDGIATIREIRKLPEGKDLPIVAVTAKAMKGDREKCMEAGAWDYLSKPVDTAHLLAVVRGWLHR
jgi:CheY-like chemotaxis protein